MNKPEKINLIKPISSDEGTIEFYTVEETGESGMSINGLAALCGVSRQAVSKLVNKFEDDPATKTEEESLKVLPGKGLDPATKTVPRRLKRFVGKEVLLKRGSDRQYTVNRKNPGSLKIYKADFCYAVIRLYAADEENDIANESADRFGAEGVTTRIQKITGWKPPEYRHFTQAQIQTRLVNTCGSPWQKRFDDEFYELLSRLTGLTLEGSKRPMLFAQLTNEFVYQHMPAHIHAKLYECRKEADGLKKLHQFLSDDGIETFNQHMEKLLILMRAATTINDLRGMLQRMFAETYQFKLFEDSRKDGKLTLSKQALAS